jgi:CBS domain-containing protein
LVLAQDVARPPRTISDDVDLRAARELLEEWELPAAPVVDSQQSDRLVGLISIAAIRAAARAELVRVSRGASH